MSKEKQTIRCAIYTRKSTEDGLDMEFNSLDAQREAAEAYIKSQQHEGWQLLPQRYDDGGFSGGTMERPGLSQLMADIEAGKIDMIVVYKVDRLSRSLHDFAKMVERFDAHGVSFVSVTQQFNTSTSMGRLTLNMLLSFAQFEREVTAERIRDKFTASKKKGMWMGGRVPLGYDVIERKLVVNETEAVWVREIFSGYLKLRSVPLLITVLQEKGITHKQTRCGLRVADKPLTENTIYGILKHPVYIGKIHHRGELYDGQHQAIIESPIWEQAKALIHQQARSKDGRYNPSGLLLQGKLYDLDGKKYRCHFSEKAKHKRHHYYVSRGKNRLPAALIEKAILSALWHPQIVSQLGFNEEQQLQWHKLLCHQPAQIIQPLISKITIGKEATWINLTVSDVEPLLQQATALPPATLPDADTMPALDITPKPNHLEIQLHLSFAEKNAIYANRARRHNKALRTALGQGCRWQQMLHDDPKLDQRTLAKREGVDYRYLTRTLQMMMLAPDIMTSMLDGTQPSHLSMNSFRTMTIPICWNEQRKLLGYVA
jgi:site-specific DNA recombinase